jgi:outer membrane protein assembly factor BamB
LNTFHIFLPPSPRLLIGITLLFVTLLLAACGGSAGDSWAGVSVNPNADSIYVSFNERVVAINPVSGAILWEYPDKDDRDAKFYAVPVVDNSTIYVGDYKGNVHAISADGDKLWVYEPDREKLIGPISPTPIDRVIGGVAVDSNKVFFGLGSRNVVAISRETAKEVWTFETNQGVWARPLYIPANPEDETSRAIVYVVSLDHYLYALDAETGDLLWKKNLGGAAPGDMIYDETRNRVYVGTFISELLAIDLSTHEITDRYKTEDWIWGRPALEDDMLYFGDLGGYLYAVRITDQGFEEEWKRSVAEGAIRGTPMVTETLVVVGSKDKHVYAVDKADGTDEWSEKTRGEVLTELLFIPGDPENEDAPDLVIVGTTERERLIMSYDVNSGDEAWHYSDKN